MPPEAMTDGTRRLENAPRTAHAAGPRLFCACWKAGFFSLATEIASASDSAAVTAGEAAGGVVGCCATRAAGTQKSAATIDRCCMVGLNKEYVVRSKRPTRRARRL